MSFANYSATHGDMFLVQLWLLFFRLVIPFARNLKSLRKHETYAKRTFPPFFQKRTREPPDLLQVSSSVSCGLRGTRRLPAESKAGGRAVTRRRRVVWEGEKGTAKFVGHVLLGDKEYCTWGILRGSVWSVWVSVASQAIDLQFPKAWRRVLPLGSLELFS